MILLMKRKDYENIMQIFGKELKTKSKQQMVVKKVIMEKIT